MSQVWIWVHANPGFSTILLFSALISTYTLIATISSHLLLGWKAFCAMFTTPPTVINQVADDEDEDDDEDPQEDDESPTVEGPKFVQTPTGSGPRPTRFDRINNS